MFMEDIMATQTVTYTKAGANFASFEEAAAALNADASGSLADVMALATVTDTTYTATSISETRSWGYEAWNAYNGRDLASAKAALEANGWSIFVQHDAGSEIVS